MPFAFDFFLHFAYIILFLWVMAEQLGVPVPSLPLLLAAGTLTATHKLSLPLVLIAAVAGCFVSDSLWYLLGKRFGSTMVKLVCRLSFERSTCVRKTEDYFTKYGEQALLAAKFVPGLGTVAAPIAGQTGMKYRVFLAYDLAGALFWAATITPIGRFFGDVLRVHPGALSWMGHFAGALFLLAIAGLLGYRIWKQQAFLKQVRTSRLDPVKRMLDGDKPLYRRFAAPARLSTRSTRASGSGTPLARNPDATQQGDPARSRCNPLHLPQRSHCGKNGDEAAAEWNLSRSSAPGRVRSVQKLGYPLEQYEDQPASIA